MFTLNLLFDISQATGLFSGDSTTQSGPLNTSMNWLKLKAIEPEPPNPDPSVFDPERPAIWEDLLEADTLLLHRIPFAPGTPDPANIAVRVAPDPDPGITLINPSLQLVISFGRPAKARQRFASPFEDAAGATLTTFVRGPVPMNTSAGWFFPLGTIIKRPTRPNKTQRYGFSIGVIVTEGPAAARKTRHYGEDPDMDIGD